jgi:hypothetical protein
MIAAAPKTSKNLKFSAARYWLRRVSSFTAMTDASEVDFSSEMALLPRAGTMARSACGSTMPPQRQQRAHPQGLRGDDLVAVHRADAAADDLTAEGRLVEREAEHRRGDRAQGQARPRAARCRGRPAGAAAASRA